MKTLLTILAYTAVILAPPLVLLWIGQGKKALVTFLLNMTIIGIPIASILGIIALREHRAAKAAA